MKIKIQRQIDSLDALYAFAKEFDDDEIKAHLARYICIRTSGLVESSVKLIVQGYLKKKCPLPVENFVNSHVANLNNVASDKISSLLAKFSTNWKNEYEEFVEGQLEESLNSVVGIRHSLAHNYNNPGITLNQLEAYWEEIKKVIWFLHGMLK